MLLATGTGAPGRCLGALLLAGATLLAAPLARAAEDVRTGSSLGLVPADAAFYSAMLRNKEQVDAVLKSQTYKKLRELPTAKMWAAKGLVEFPTVATSLVEVVKVLQDKEYRELVDVLQDALAQEVFVYGGPAWPGLLSTYTQANAEGAAASLEALVDRDPLKRVKAQFHAMLAAAQKERATLKVPELVLGGKLSDEKKAVAALARVEKLLGPVLDAQPAFKGRLKRTKLPGGADGLTLTLESKQIPWDEVEKGLGEFVDRPGEFDDLLKHLKGLELTVTLGIRKGYLLLALTGKPADVGKFGGPGKKLADHPDFKPLAKYAGKRITSLGYVSKAQSTVWKRAGDPGTALRAVKRLLAKVDIPAERRASMQKDLDEIERQSRAWQPSGGAQLSATWRTDTGYEGYSWDQGDHSALKGRKLRLAEHLGGQPIFAAAAPIPVVAGGGTFPLSKLFASYTQLPFQVPVIGLSTFGALEPLLLAEKPDAKPLSVALPLVQKLDASLVRDFLPATRDGELGIVLDAGWKSQKWWKSGPEFPRPVPGLEVGLLVGISDGERFQKALKEWRLSYMEAFQAVFSGGKEGKENQSLWKVPAPETQKEKAGTLFYYAIPEEAGLDRQFVPTGGVSKTTAALTLSKEHTLRLLTPTPPKFPAGPLTAHKDLVALAYLDFPRLVDAALPWVEAWPALVPAEDKVETGRQAKDVKAALELLKAYRGFQSASYLEGGVLVTHRVTTIQER